MRELTRSPRFSRFEVEFVWDIYNCVPEEILLVRVLQFESATESRVLYYWPSARQRRRSAAGWCPARLKSAAGSK